MKLLPPPASDPEDEVGNPAGTSSGFARTSPLLMELPEELPEPENFYDGCTYYIQVETADDTHKAGGYEAGRENDSDSRRFKGGFRADSPDHWGMG